MIVEYRMHRNDLRQLVTPSFVDDGGYFHNSADGTYVGWINEPAEHHVPDTVAVLTAEQLEDRLLARPVRGFDGSEMSAEDVRGIARRWLAERRG